MGAGEDLPADARIPDPTIRSGIRIDFDELAVPMAAIELRDLRIVAVTPAVFPDDPSSTAGMIGRPVLDVIDPVDRRAAKLALEALAAGGVDFVRAHGRLTGSDRNQVYTHWVAAVEIDGERLALAQIAAGRSPGPSPLAKYLAIDPIEFAVGTVTKDWVISTVSTGVEKLLGIPDREFTGRVLLGAVAQRDVERVLSSAHKAESAISVGLAVSMRTANGTWSPVRVVLGSLAESSDRFFILARQPAGPDLRTLKLEEHLRRIAVEVEASGILEVAPSIPTVPHLAGRAQLTPRQWEVLTRLLRGERTATIAEELFVSESTVRNHLSAIYDRFGVGSQSELMALAIGGREASSRTDGTSMA